MNNIDAEINEVNKTVKGNINKNIVEEFGHKLAFLYLVIYDTRVKAQEIGEINKQLIDHKRNLDSVDHQVSDLNNQIVDEICLLRIHYNSWHLHSYYICHFWWNELTKQLIQKYW